MSRDETTASVDWEATLVQHDRWLRTVVYARLRCSEAVDEVLQEVALAAVRQAAPLVDPRKAAPWLYRLALRQVLMYRRRRGRQRRLLDQYAGRRELASGGYDGATPLGWLLADERRDLVRRALEQVSKRDAEMLLLKYTEHWSYRQIAEHLGIRETAVQARLHQARQRMRQQLAALNVGEGKP